MRNLRVVRCFKSDSPLPLPASSVFCLGENGYLFDAIGIQDSEGSEQGNHEHFLSNLIRISEFAHIEELVKSNGLKDIFQMQFIHDTGCLYLANKRGYFLQYYLQVGEVEELFQSEKGLSTFSVSPDSRLVTLITKTGDLLLLSLPDLGLVFETVLLSEEAPDIDIAKTQISWRHDSHYFALNLPAKNDLRKICIYDEHGALFSTTVDSIQLISNIVSWQPSGGLIASIEKPPIGKKGYLITFFELNGLKRSDFNPMDGRTDVYDDEMPINLSWNSNSDILAVQKSKSIDLWYRSNYVWMLKGIVRPENVDNVSDPIRFFSWDRDAPYKLHVVTEIGYYMFYDFNLTYSSGISQGSNLTVALNGANVYSTPFRDNSCPPPYGFNQTKLESTIKHVVVPNFWDGFACVLWTGKLVLVKNGKGECETSIYKTFELDKEENLLSAYNWIWPNRNTMCCVSNNRILLYKFESDIEAESQEMLKLKLEHSIKMNCSSLQPVCLNTEESFTILVRKHGGSLLLMNLKVLDSSPEVLYKVPANCFHNLKYMLPENTQNTFEDIAKKIILVGHDQVTRKLEVFSAQSQHGIKLANDCTSVTTFEDYLLFTTIQGTVEIIHISQVLHGLNSSANGKRSDLEQYSRKVEKGSIILCCCWNQMQEPTLVLQIVPRGNIETIYPRPLIMSSIKHLLRDKNIRSFSIIMTAMRRHRIDANVLLNELKVVEQESIHGLTIRDSFDCMVKEVEDPNILVLFVTEINADNMQYVEEMKTVLEPYALSKDDCKKAIQPYLAAMARLGLYEEVLNSPLILGEPDRETVKRRVTFLSFYSDNPEVLYEAALGTYDLSLAAVVADCLNKDPKEYLPILNQLRTLSQEKKCFSIDTTLRRWSKGMSSLFRDPSVSVDEIVAFIKKYRLFPDALSSLSKSGLNGVRTAEDCADLRRAIQLSYGEYLETHDKLREAGIYYHRCGVTPKAIECCIKAGDWELALTMIETKKSKGDTGTMLTNILASFESKGDFEGAARFSELFLGDTALAVDFWTRAKKWLTALTLLQKDQSLANQVTETIKPKILQGRSSLLELIRSLEKDLQHYNNRLKLVKTAKEKAELENDNDNTGDSFSDTESISTTSSIKSSTRSSNMSGKTYRSGKNKRKHERKLYSLKEGSKYEDIAITVHLWEMITRIHHEVKKEVSYTVESLWRLELDEEAETLTSLFDELIKVADICVKDIWATVIPENPLLDAKFRIAPFQWSLNWDKLSFLSSPLDKRKL